MKCPKCGVELRISRTYTSVEGDQSPETSTKVFTVQDLVCKNKNCENYDKVVKTTRSCIYGAP